VSEATVSGAVSLVARGGEGQVTSLAAYELQLLLWNGNPDTARVSPLWKQLPL